MSSPLWEVHLSRHHLTPLTAEQTPAPCRIQADQLWSRTGGWTRYTSQITQRRVRLKVGLHPVCVCVCDCVTVLHVEAWDTRCFKLWLCFLSVCLCVPVFLGEYDRVDWAAWEAGARRRLVQLSGNKGNGDSGGSDWGKQNPPACTCRGEWNKVFCDSAGSFHLSFWKGFHNPRQLDELKSHIHKTLFWSLFFSLLSSSNIRHLKPLSLCCFCYGHVCRLLSSRDVINPLSVTFFRDLICVVLINNDIN